MDRLLKKLALSKSYTKTIVLILLVLAFFSGFYLENVLQRKTLNDFTRSFRSIRLQNGEYNLIDPLIGTISPPATNVGIFKDIQSEIEEYLKVKEKNGDLEDFSFYFRELNSSLWFGINEEKSFTPASLLKIPIAIAVYKQTEDDQSFSEDQKLVYTSDIASMNNNSPINDTSSLVIGKSYTVKDLVSLMIEKSDNGAKNLLLSSIDKKYLINFLTLVFPDTELSGSNYDISSTKYSLFLRILYNSSYLNKKNSQQLLYLLTKSTFEEGLVAGVPRQVQVAHKFGIYNDGQSILLHDCGIVYHEEDPFVICLMTKGRDHTTLLKIISEVSGMVYQYHTKNI